MSAGDPATKGHLFALLLEIRDLLSNIDMKDISQELSAAFALSDQEKTKRDEYVQLISDGEVLKKSLDEQKKSTTEQAMTAEKTFEDAQTLSAEVEIREELVKKAKTEIDSRQQAQDARDKDLDDKASKIENDNALLVDAKKDIAQKIAQNSIWEGKLKDQQSDIQSILNKMK